MAILVPVDDPDDPRVAAFRDIRERDLVGRQRAFVAEGEVVLRVLARRAPHRAVSLLVAQNRLDGLGDILAGLPPDVPVHVASQAVMDRIAGFPIHRGILALGRAEPPAEPDALLAGFPRRAALPVLVGIANHDNMGGIFRNAAAFGVPGILIDAASCDPLYRKAIRVSVGAALIVPHARLPAGADVVALLERHGFTPVALSPAGRDELRDFVPPPRAAYLFGTEGPGLPADLMARTRTLRIPMAAGFDSLNVATTAGIVLHHHVASAR